MKITINIDCFDTSQKVFNILSAVKSEIIKIKSGIAGMIEVIGATAEHQIVNLKIVMRASRVRMDDKLKITIRWGEFANDEPGFRKIIVHAERTVDDSRKMLFQFEIPREGKPREGVIITGFIIRGIMEALNFQKDFLDDDREFIANQIKKLEMVIAESIGKNKK